MRAGAAMADAFEDSLSARKPSAPSMSSKCSISAWSWPTAPSSALPATLLVPRLTRPCRDWRKGGRRWEAEGQTQTERVSVRERGERVWGRHEETEPANKAALSASARYTLAVNTELLIKDQEGKHWLFHAPAPSCDNVHLQRWSKTLNLPVSVQSSRCEATLWPRIFSQKPDRLCHVEARVGVAAFYVDAKSRQMKKRRASRQTEGQRALGRHSLLLIPLLIPQLHSQST